MTEKKPAPGFPSNQSLMVKAVKDMEFLFCIVALLVCFFHFFPFSNCLALESRWIPLPVCSVFIVFSEACDSGQGAVFLSVARGKVHVGKGSSSEQSAK